MPEGEKEYRQPWDRQSNENSLVFSRFCVFRDLGPSRTLSVAAARCGSNKAAMGQLSSRYDWTARAAAYDEFWERRHREIVEDKHQREFEEIADSMLTWARNVVITAGHRLTLDFQEIKREVDSGGMGVGMSFTSGHAARHMEVALRIMQYFRPPEEGTQVVEQVEGMDYLDDLMAELNAAEGDSGLAKLAAPEIIEGTVVSESDASPED